MRSKRHDPLRTMPSRSKRRGRQASRGAGAAELVVVLPLALLCLLGLIQLGLLFHAKGQLNHAAVQAARAGSIAHAGEARIREGLARGLVPFMGGGVDAAQLAGSYALALGEAALAGVEILSPVQQSFTDYASPAESQRLRAEESLDTAEPVIPNLNIAGRACPYDRASCNADPARNASGQSLQDANLLKLRITWGIPAAKQVPLAGPAIVQVLRAQALLDADMPAMNRALIAAGRIPVVATAIVRMQSEPIRNGLMAQAARAPQPAANAASGPAAPASAASAPSTPASGAGNGGGAGAGGGTPRPAIRPSICSVAPRAAYRPKACVVHQAALDQASRLMSSICKRLGPRASTVIALLLAHPLWVHAQGTTAPASPSTPSAPAAAPSCGGAPSTPPCGGGGPASQGQNDTPAIGAGNPIHLATGNKHQTEIDMPALPGVLGLELVRHYNSALSRSDAVNGNLGRGWRLSYETSLHVIGATVQILQADGGRVIFSRDPKNPSHCASADAAQGFVQSTHGAKGERFIWHWSNGRKLYFDERGQLEQIVAPSGEFVRLRHDREGRLLQVIDPQGRSLELHYAEASAERRYLGVDRIDTPVGRYDYAFGGALPEGSQAAAAVALARLVRVVAPTDSQGRRNVRHYVHEDARQPTLLTGIAVGFEGQEPQRLVTWAYDDRGRAILSLKGPADDPASERIILRYPQAASPAVKRAVTEAITPRGTTVYEHAVIGGEHRLLQARGPGCASCAESERAYDYDAQGRLIAASRLDAKGRPIETVRTERDALGRPVRVERGKGASFSTHATKHANRALPTTATLLLARYEYSADRDLDGRLVANFEPSLIATPSVIDGREHQWRLERNDLGQVVRIAETGYSPLDAQGQASEGTPIERSTGYRYKRINGRSLLVETDGPLPNGPMAEPSDSDITRFVWDERGDHILHVERAGALAIRLDRDEAGRLIANTDPSGIVTRIAYAVGLQASRIERAGRVTTYDFDAQGRTERIADAGRTVRLGYDAAGRLKTATDAQGYRAQAQFDADGLPSIAGLYEPGQDQPLRAIYRWHDDHRRLVRQLRPDGRFDTWSYDDRGRLFEHTDGDDVRHLTVKRAHLDLSLDGLLRISTETDGRDPSQPSTRRDDFGRIVMQWRPEQGLSLRSFDAADRLAREDRLDRKAKPAGQSTYRHDAAGHLVERVDTEATGQMSSTAWQYELGRLVEERNDAERRSFTHDEAGRIESTRIELLDAHGRSVYVTTLATTYDASSGEATTRTLADGSVMHIAYDAFHTATGIALQSAEAAGWHDRFGRWLPAGMASQLQARLARTSIASDIALHPFNGVTAYLQGNGIRTTRGFDIAGRLTTLRIGTVDAMLAAQKLGYGIGPRVRNIEDSAGEVTKARYDYTGFGALKTEGATTVRTSAAKASSSTERDAQGRTASDGHQRYTYTSQGQVEAVSSMEGQPIASYRHNARGQRVSKTLASGATTFYLWQDGLLVAEIERGGVTNQYLYLGNAGRMQPLAKLEAADASGNATGKARLLHVHASHRGEPVAMTDASQRVVWKSKPDEWGYVKASDLEGQQAQLNLRLPGQYFDAESWLHDNWHRSYDPRPDSATRGSYLSPDPLGYVDGPDPYLYASGDPINKIDPQGLYQQDIHYYMTFFLALTAGLSYEHARITALAAQYVDDNPMTRPLDESTLITMGVSALRNHQQLLNYHFVLSNGSGYTQFEYANANVNSVVETLSPQLTNLYAAASRGVPSQPCARYQFLGEFLHSYADTFSHRHEDNQPFHAFFFGAGVGHGFHGSQPDYTFNAANWPVREGRTLAAERAMYDVLRAHGSGSAVPVGQIEQTLRQFNAIEESDGNFESKRRLLQEAINSLIRGGQLNLRRADGSRVDAVDLTSGEATETYDRQTAEQNRNRLLANLSESEYAGVCLPGGTRCVPF